MSRFPGNIIKLPNVTPTQSSASGVWSLKDQMVYQRNNLWPFQRDPYFNYTTLLLQGNVPNTTGPQAMNLPLAYNADASTNNFLVTPNGDVGPRPFSPYFGGNYSVFFDGNADYLTLADSSDWVVNTDYTIEFWANAVSFPGQYNNIFAQSSGSQYWGMNWDTSLGWAFFWNNGAGETKISRNQNTPLYNWVHVAVVKSGTTGYMFLNGMRAGATFTFPSINDISSLLYIGSWVTPGDYFNGYISNLRFVKGTALYTSDFIPSTVPLQNIPNTVLLTCQSNRFIDNSSTPKTITRNGDSRITDNSPFVSTDFTTGAGYFDGSDFLQAANNAAFGSLNGVDYTIEFWVYQTTISGDQAILGCTSIGVSGFAIWTLAGQLNAFFGGGSTITGATLTANQWNHIALVRTSTNTQLYLNGVSQGTPSTSAFVNNTSQPLMIGGITTGTGWNSDRYTTGYISAVRVIKGQALATGNFTPPTALASSTVVGWTGANVPTQSITGSVSLLTLQTRAPSQNINFIDSSPNEFIVTKNGNTTQGTFSPFSPTGWSNQFNGSNNGFTVPASSAFSFAGEFTWEAFVCLNSIPSSGTAAFICSSRNTTASNSSFQFGIYNRPSVGTEVNVTISTGSTDYGLGWTITTPTIGVWYHVAVVRNSSNVVSCYWDGSLKTLTTGSSSAPGTTNTPTVVVSVGYRGTPNNDLYFNGYISNLRMIAAAMYSGSSITIPTAPFSPTVANTRFLTCQSNRFAETAAGMAITLTNSPSVQAFSPFAPANAVSPLVTGGSGYFDGGASSSADYLTWTGTAAGAGAFSYEFWVYSTNGFATMRAPLGVIAISGYNSALDIRMSGSTINASQYNVTSNNFTVETLQANTWYHVVICRNTSNQMTVFLNGTRSSTGALTISTNFSGLTSAIGRLDPNNGGDVTGYITGVRLVVGSTPYDPTQTTIPVPTAPPTAIPNTSLLLNFTNGAAVDATGKNNLESVGKAQNSGVQAKWDRLLGGSSLQFDGSTATVRGNTPANWIYLHDGSSWTIEFWLYPVDIVNFQGLICTNGAGSANIGLHVVISSSTINVSFTRGVVGSSASFTSTGTLTANSWNFVGITFNGSTKTCSFFINGASAGSSSNTGFAYSSSAPTYPLNIGQTGDPTYPYFLNGYIDDLRITRGIARTITANPTGPFPIG